MIFKRPSGAGWGGSLNSSSSRSGNPVVRGPGAGLTFPGRRSRCENGEFSSAAEPGDECQSLDHRPPILSMRVRILKLTTLATDIIEAILNGELNLAGSSSYHHLVRTFPMDWELAENAKLRCIMSALIRQCSCCRALRDSSSSHRHLQGTRDTSMRCGDRSYVIDQAVPPLAANTDR